MFENVEAFYRPASIREALQLLHGGKGRARIVAGCTDVAVEDDPSIRFLIDITQAGLSYIRQRGSNWAIGATTTMAQIEESPELHQIAGGILASAAATCGSVQIRNMATMGGNMANGSQAADMATPLLALDASATVADAKGRHRMPLADYLLQARSRKPANSLLAEVTFASPPHGAHCGWSFQKFGRTAVDISLVNVAAGLQLESHRRVKWARIALGAVASMPIRMPDAEALMIGHKLDHALVAEVCESVLRGVHPIADQRASAEFRRELSRVLTGRALEQCAASAECEL